MKINISSKSVSIGISFLIFLAVGILAVALIGKGSAEENISFDIFSDVNYSEHEGWTDISNVIDDASDENDMSSEQNDVLDAEEIETEVNSKYQCSGNITDLQFSDEMGIKIEKITFLNGYTPENISISLGYVFAGDRIFDVFGNDLTEILLGYKFVCGRDAKGNALFEKDGEYFYLEDNNFFKSQDVNNLVNGPSYISVYDENYILFKSGEYWGIKNISGEILVEAQYTYGYGLNEGVACFASKAKRLYFYNTEGKLISSEFFVPEKGIGAFRVQNGITLVSNGEKNLIMKSTGSVLDVPTDYEVLGCSDGMILLRKNNRFGFMNQKGEWATSPDYDYASFYSEGLSVVSKNGLFVIDQNGDTIIPKGFDYVSDFTNGVSFLYSSEKGWYVAKKLFME